MPIMGGLIRAIRDSIDIRRKRHKRVQRKYVPNSLAREEAEILNKLGQIALHANSQGDNSTSEINVEFWAIRRTRDAI